LKAVNENLKIQVYTESESFCDIALFPAGFHTPLILLTVLDVSAIDTMHKELPPVDRIKDRFSRQADQQKYFPTAAIGHIVI
jgi:hypothetical protein